MIGSLFCSLGKAFGGCNIAQSKDIPSPRDIIPQGDISYDSELHTLTIKNIEPSIWLTSVADTNSMDGLLDYGHTCILTNAFKYEDLAVGDVVVYWNGSQNIIHQIIKIKEDALGRVYTLKGINNASPDPYLIRDEHIQTLLLGIIF